jgi:uncharacterized protein with FMN-binding domain
MKTLRIFTTALSSFLILWMGCSAGKTIIGGPIPHANLKDGTYDGTAANGPVRVKARVTINDQRIAGVDLIEHRTWKGGAAEGIIPDRIIDKQSTKVDAVSGATMSSVAIMNAVEDAVKKAQ